MSIPRLVVRPRQDPAINASPSTTNRPRRRHLGQGLVLAAATALALVGCSADSKSLSGSNSLAPLITGTPPPTTTTTSVPVATSTTITGVSPIATTLVPPTTVFNTTLITMSPPRISPPSTAATTAGPPDTAAPDTAPPDTAPGDTAAPDTAPPDTSPPATDPPPSSCNSCDPNYRFPYSSFFTVPQLGSEPVRGSGCGANGTVGNTIPDGVWDGHISVGGSSLQIDLECVYYGDSAAPYIAQCEADNGGDCFDSDPDFFIVNNNTRKRSVPLDPSFRRRYATSDGCSDPGPGQGGPAESSDAMTSWVVIEGGQATFALTSCVYG